MMKVFVYGDSISMQYGFPLEELLSQNGLKYERLGGNNSHDLACLKYNGLSTREMLEWIKAVEIMKETILIFNCGLHDIVRSEITSECQVPLEDYRLNIEKIIAVGRTKFDKLAFCNTTPVDDERHNKGISSRFRFNKDVLSYNNAAKMVMKKENIPVIDLYSLTMKKTGKEEIYIDHVHMKESISKIHAEKIIEELARNGYIDG